MANHRLSPRLVDRDGLRLIWCNSRADGKVRMEEELTALFGIVIFAKNECEKASFPMP
ncbi:hypothetical protein BAG01nite_27290 [Brevibacillus agri]|uniref:Uncharacterized protein n=1 Tax=Brevibacillus agri TaxID=51101 RepID=A0ABQ0SRV1_9BACL|nr:hypothetical protein BAG01nite_27290 [Brevibacillus agri]